MSDYLEEGFEDWLKDLPVDFIKELYGMYLNNTLGGNDTLASINGNDLTYVGPLNIEFREVINFVRKPKRKRIKPITEDDIKKLNYILRDNGIEESA